MQPRKLVDQPVELNSRKETKSPTRSRWPCALSSRRIRTFAVREPIAPLEAVFGVDLTPSSRSADSVRGACAPPYGRVRSLSQDGTPSETHSWLAACSRLHGPTPFGYRKSTPKSPRKACEGLWDWNLQSDRIHFSPGWISLVGCQDHEVGNSPETWFQRVHPEDRDQLARDIGTLRADGPCDFDLRYRMRHKDGAYRWMSSRGLVVRNDAGEAIRLTGSQTDVTVETVTDPLTGLPNRLLLVDRLTQSIERAFRSSTFHFALLLLDIGRPAGARPKPGPTAVDPLLNGAARRLETCLRIADMMPDLRQNDLVARVHDDRLAVLLDGVTDLHHAKVVADRILVEMLQPLTLSNREARLSPTIGIAVSATGYTHADDVLRDAETALHRAEVLGGSHCELFDADVLKSEQADLQLENDFELALERREFALVYQPIVSIAAHRVVGFEALVRWHHPVFGVITPLDFIPIAERTGFIVPLGNWILHEPAFGSVRGRPASPRERCVGVRQSLRRAGAPPGPRRRDRRDRAQRPSSTTQPGTGTDRRYRDGQSHRSYHVIDATAGDRHPHQH